MLKKKCLSRRRNVSTVWQSTTSLGRTFQSLEPAARNVRSPTVARRTLGTSSRCVRADWSRRLRGMSAMQIRSSTRYCGANSCNDLKTNIATLNCMRSDTLRQWRLASVSMCGLSAEDQRWIGNLQLHCMSQHHVGPITKGKEVSERNLRILQQRQIM